MKNIAVVAGTKVDTRMGVDYITEVCKKDGQEYIPFPCQSFESPKQCHIFQMMGTSEKEKYFTEIFKKAINEKDAEAFFIYCNSLSAAFDFEALGKKLNVRVVTPLMAYREIAKQYSKLAVIAANNQSTAGIEAAFTAGNPDCYLMGLGMLNLVESVESGISPQEIIEKHNLSLLLDFFKRNGAEALVLGCTHFPYFEEALKKISNMPVINPAEKMYQMLQL